MVGSMHANTSLTTEQVETFVRGLSASSRDVFLNNYRIANRRLVALARFAINLYGMNEMTHKNNDVYKALTSMFIHFVNRLSDDAETLRKSDEVVVEAFNGFMESYVKNPIEIVQQLSQAIQYIDNKLTKQKAPIHPALATIIGGIIGAVVGGVIFATIGAAFSCYVGGIAAIPAFFVGLVKGFMVGSTLSVTAGVSMYGLSAGLATIFYKHSRIARQMANLEAAKLTIDFDIQRDLDGIKRLYTKPLS